MYYLTVLQFQKFKMSLTELKYQAGSRATLLSGGSGGKFILLPFPTSRRCIGALAQAPFSVFKASKVKVFHTLTLLTLLSSLKSLVITLGQLDNLFMDSRDQNLDILCFGGEQGCLFYLPHLPQYCQGTTTGMHQLFVFLSFTQTFKIPKEKIKQPRSGHYVHYLSMGLNGHSHQFCVRERISQK